MACEPIISKGKVHGFACGRGKPEAPQKCSACGQYGAHKLCDWEEDGKICSKKLCAECSWRPGAIVALPIKPRSLAEQDRIDTVDFCPKHRSKDRKETGKKTGQLELFGERSDMNTTTEVSFIEQCLKRELSQMQESADIYRKELEKMHQQLCEQTAKTDLLMTAIKAWLEVPFFIKRTRQIVKAEKGILDAYNAVKGMTL